MRVILQSNTQSDPTVISAFPGTGKTLFARTNENCIDLDSSGYSNTEYVEAILSVVGTCKRVLVSTHAETRIGLVQNSIPFLLVYPEIELKSEYLERYRQRGSPPAFIDMMQSNWNTFILSCMSQKKCTHIILKSGEYLSDIGRLFKRKA